MGIFIYTGFPSWQPECSDSWPLFFQEFGLFEEQLVMSVYKKYHDGVLLRNMERTLKSEGFYRSEKVGIIANLFLCYAKTILETVVVDNLR